MKLYLIALLSLVILVAPTASEAFYSTTKTSVRLNDNTLLFLVSYQFGHEKDEYQLPIGAFRSAVGVGDFLSYDIVTGNGLRTNIGQTMSLVVSDAKVKDGMYYVPKGKQENFTLVTFLMLPEERSASTTDFSLQVNRLPIIQESFGKTTKFDLPPSLLNSYKTEVVSTNKAE